MAEPTSEAQRADPAARPGASGMGVAIASIIAFLIVAVGAFWMINGTVTEIGPHPAIAAEPATAQIQAGPGQIGNIGGRRAAN